MKKIVLFVFIFSTFRQVIFGYCSISAVYTSDTRISNVTLNTINNPTNYSTNVYTDYSNTVAPCTLTTCQTYSLSFSVIDYSSAFHTGSNSINFVADYYTAIWIDFNNNNVFDANEKLGEINSIIIYSFINYTYNLNFNVPSNAINGLTRMRVMFDYSNPGLSPCASTNGGPYEVEDYTVYINTAAPNISMSNSSPVCQGDNLNLYASGGTSYSWTGPNGFTSSQQNPVVNSVSNLNNGTYTVTVTGANCATASSSQYFSVSNLPNPAIGFNSPVCAGNQLQLSPGCLGQYFSWTGPNGFNSTTDFPSISSVSAANTGNYSVYVVDGNGCSSTSTSYIAVNNNPVIPLSSNSPVCEGNNLQLNSGGGISYSWTGPNNFTSGIANPLIPASTVNNNGYYDVTVIDGNGCTNSASLYAVVNSNPTANAGNNASYCEFGTVQLTGSGSGGLYFSWTGPNGFSSSSQNPIINSIPLSGNGQYNLTVTNSNSCSASASVNIIVNPLPVVSTSGNSPVCETNDILLNATTNGANYYWTGPGGYLSYSQNSNITNAMTFNSGSYTFTAITGNCSNSSSITVLVNRNPVITLFSNSPVCIGQDLQLFADSGLIYSWTGPGGFTSVIENPIIPQITGVNSGLYTLTATESLTGCSSTSAIQVNALQNPSLFLGADTIFCQNTISLDAGNAGASFLWSDQSTNSTLIVDSTGQYAVKVTDVNGCYSSDTINVTVNSLPIVYLNLSTDTVCSTSGAQLLTGGTPLNGTYSGPGISGNYFIPANSGTGNQGITYSYLDSLTGCTNTAIDSIFVNICSGIEEQNQNKNYSLYPNPFNSILTIENYKRQGKLVIELMTIEARFLQSWKFENEEKCQLDLGDLSAGIYFLLLKSDNGTGFFRIYKQ